MGDDEVLKLLRAVLTSRPDLRSAVLEETPPEAPPEPTVAQLWQEFADWVQPAPSAKPKIKSWRNGRSSGRRLMNLEITLAGEKTTLGALPASRCDLKAIDAWRKARAQQTTIRKGAVKPSTRDRELSWLQSMFTWHVDRGTLTKSPVTGMDREKKKNEGKRQGYYTDEQLEAYLSGAHPLLAKMMRLSFRCGAMRQDEVRLLQIHEVDWDREVIILSGDRTKNGEPRVITVTRDEMEMLRAQRATAPGTYLFPNPQDPSGGPVPKGTLGGWLARAKKRCSWLRLMGEAPTYHHTRHSWAVHQIWKGAPVSAVMDEAGWSSVEIMRGYTKLAGVARDHMREIVNRPSPLGARKGPVGAHMSDNSSDVADTSFFATQAKKY